MNKNIFVGAVFAIAGGVFGGFTASLALSQSGLEEINLECVGSPEDFLPAVVVHIDKNRSFGSRNTTDLCDLQVFKAQYVLHCDQGTGATVIVSRHDLTAIEITLDTQGQVRQTEVQCVEVSDRLRI